MSSVELEMLRCETLSGLPRHWNCPSRIFSRAIAFKIESFVRIHSYRELKRVNEIELTFR